jgi:hypothetical protein
MPEYVARFTTQIEVSVTLDADDEDTAADAAWDVAEEYLRTVHGHRPSRVTASATLDGVGASEVEEIHR